MAGSSSSPSLTMCALKFLMILTMMMISPLQWAALTSLGPSWLEKNNQVYNRHNCHNHHWVLLGLLKFALFSIDFVDLENRLFLNRIPPYIFPNLTKTLGWVGKQIWENFPPKNGVGGLPQSIILTRWTDLTMVGLGGTPCRSRQLSQCWTIMCFLRGFRLIVLRSSLNKTSRWRSQTQRCRNWYYRHEMVLIAFLNFYGFFYWFVIGWSIHLRSPRPFF